MGLPATAGEDTSPAATGVAGLADSFRGLGDTPLAKGDVDLRGTIAPSLLQRRAADALHATVRWNDFGTPASLLPTSGSLGRAGSANPVTAARGWLRSHAGVLGLSAAEVDALDVVNEQQLAGIDAHAVLFRQRFGGLVPAVGGMVTVGVADGEITYVSSSLVKNAKRPPAAVLTPRLGWLAAVADIGADWLGLDELVRLTDITAAFTKDGWTRLRVAGFPQEQQARLRALAMADGTVRPVIEANVVNVAGGDAAAYTVLVDAVDGTTLWRASQVEQFVDAHAHVATAPVMPVLEDHPSKLAFQGAFDGECGQKHEFEITDSETRQIVALATALNPVNDIVLKLFGPGGELLTSGDTGTSPEAALYSGDPLPKGTYAVQPCMYDGAAPLPPANYFGNVSVSSQATPGGTDAVPFPPRWRYFPTNPTPKFGAGHTPTNSVVGCWVTSHNQQKVRGCTEPRGALRNNGSPSPWDTNANTGLPTFTTLGNNASDREAWLSPLTPGGLLQAPIALDRQYTPEFTDAWNNSKCDPAQLVPGGNDIDFSATNLFVAHNRMHDYSYFLGFTEKNYNLQLHNFGNGGLGNDPEIGNVQAGALTGGALTDHLGRDNANQIALQDGIPGITNQYLFQPIAGAFYAPCTDGGLDMGIVAHEYAHAITNRMIGGPDEGITSAQGGAMGESWGDLIAGEYQFSHGYSNGGNVWAVGLYATGNLKTAIRNYAIDQNPLTYGELGYDSTGNQVHADGEIWSATMWRVRQALVRKFERKGFSYDDRNLQARCATGVPNLGPKQSYDCPGNRRWVQLMFDSFLLQQGATSMLDARDAFIAADRMRYQGSNRDVLWKAFARSGMGTGAKTADADAGDPEPSFKARRGNRTVAFRPTLPNGKKVAGTVFIGTYEARATPVADTVKKTELGAAIAMTPGTYPAVFRSPKTGLTRFTVKVKPGKGTLRRSFTVRPNLASLHNGATVTGAPAESRNPDFLIDGTEATNWGVVSQGNVDETTPSITVDLAGKKAKKIRRVAVSALLRPGDVAPNPLPVAQADEDPDAGSRFTALRKFAIEVCRRGCSGEGGAWTRVYTSTDAAFPSVEPRPTSPTLSLRSFRFKPVKASAVRLVVLENQCTGYAGYAGEQDNDPLNDTDCKTATDRGTIAHAAELQVFGR